MIENKIKTIEELAKIVQKEKEAGHKIALSHGCFDMVHIGHMKHFRAVKKMADKLIVTVTPDCFITKGPGRPVLNESLRLEALANLEVIDYVGLNDSPDAVFLIERVKPDFYVKGDEYKNFKDHLAGKRVKEKEAIERYGGKFVFTSEPTYSSTAFINQNFNHLSPETSEFIKRIREKHSVDEIKDCISKMSELKVLVIGDPIIDEYDYCRTVGTITKAPAISAVYKNNLKMTGASMIVARHVAEFVKSVDYIGVVGGKDNEKGFIEEELKNGGVRPHLIVAPDRFTILKRRFISGNYPSAVEFKNGLVNARAQKLFEIAFMEDNPIDESVEKEVCLIFEKLVKENDLVILADFGHGMITPKIRGLIAEKSKWWGLTVQTNSTNFGFNLVTKYKNPNFLCIDELEARLPFSDRYKDKKEIIKDLSGVIECDEIMMSMGREGLMLKTDDFYYAPALILETEDTVGAGDAVLSLASLCSYLKFPPLVRVFLSATAGALATQVICNVEPVRKRKFVQFVNGTLKI